MSSPPARAGLAQRIAELPGNAFGIPAALLGYIVGFVAGSLLLGAVDAAKHHPNATTGLGPEAAGLVGLWIGLLLAALVGGRRSTEVPRSLRERLRDDYGLAFRLIDVPIGIVVGLAAQFLLVPLFELPLLPFVPHLFQRLGTPARVRTLGVSGFGVIVLGLLICVGSPIVEELYFRGVVLRGLLGAVRQRVGLGALSSALVSVVATAVVFGLAHFEALQLLGLIGAGMAFGLLAAATHRLGPGMVAHMAFNTVAFVSVARLH